MKTFLTGLGVVALGATGISATTVDEQFETKTVQRAQEALVVVEPEPQNRIAVDDLTFNGVAVAVVKADSKLQLLNPVAPEEYGNVEESVVRDPTTGVAAGLKIFSLEF